MGREGSRCRRIRQWLYHKALKKMREEENWLFRIPVLGYFLRKINGNRKAIEITLRTGKETKGETKKSSFFCGLLGISSEKKFNILKLRKT